LLLCSPLFICAASTSIHFGRHSNTGVSTRRPTIYDLEPDGSITTLSQPRTVVFESASSTTYTMDGMEGLYKPKSLADRRASLANSEEGASSSPTRSVLTLDTMSTRLPSRVEKDVQTRPRGPPTPNLTTPAELDSPTHSNHDPPPPPTPAASPGPDNMRPDWSAAGDQEDIFLAQIRQYFKQRSGPERTRILGDLLNLCTSQQLSFVSQYVSPLLKKDPFTSLPDELCLRVCNAFVSFLRLRLLMFQIRCSHLSTTERFWPELPRFHGDGEIYWPMT